MKSSIMKYSNSFMTATMLAIFLVMVETAAHYPAGARFMPFLVGIPAIALCLLQLALDARQRHRAAEAEDTRSELQKVEENVSRMVGRHVDFEVAHAPMPVTVEAAIPPEETVRREMVIWGYFLGFIAAILAFGFWVAIPVYLIAFLRFQAKTSWRTSLVLGVGGTVVLFFVFEWGLRAQLHTGFIIDYLRG